jgi:hypothetical protein
MKILFKHFKKRFSIFLLRKFYPNKYRKCSNPTDKQIFDVCRRLINHPQSQLINSGKNNKKYIQNPKLKILLIIDNCRATIVNHVFGYNISIEDHTYNRILHLFSSKIENDIKNIEEKYAQHTFNSLNYLNKKTIKKR